MAIFTVRISDELKKRMEKHKHINWNEVVRQAILRTLEKEERNLAKAVLLNEKNVIVPEEGYSSVEIIRKWRDCKIEIKN